MIWTTGENILVGVKIQYYWPGPRTGPVLQFSPCKKRKLKFQRFKADMCPGFWLPYTLSLNHELNHFENILERSNNVLTVGAGGHFQQSVGVSAPGQPSVYCPAAVWPPEEHTDSSSCPAACLSCSPDTADVLPTPAGPETAPATGLEEQMWGGMVEISRLVS